MASGRQREKTGKCLELHDWLRLNVENNSIPGLIWNSQEKDAFRIPWPHLRSQNIPIDTDIFRAYAEFRGQRVNGMEDIRKWKHKLRSAINKNRFILILEDGELQNNSCPPFLVCKFVRKQCLATKKKCKIDLRTTCEERQSKASLGQILEDVRPGFTSMSMTMYTESHSSSTVDMENNEIPTANNFPAQKTTRVSSILQGRVSTAPDIQNTSNQLSLAQPLFCRSSNQFLTRQKGTNSEVRKDQDPNFSSCNLLAENFTNFSLNDGNGKLSNSVNLTSSCTAAFPSNHQLSLSQSPGGVNVPANTSSDSAPALVEIQIICGVTAKSVIKIVHLTQSRQTCRIFFRKSDHARLQAEAVGPEDTLQVCLMSVEDLKDKSFTDDGKIMQILNLLGRGIFISYENGDIYAERKSQAYVYLSDGVQASTPLKKGTKEKIFDYNKFHSTVESHSQDQSIPIGKDHCLLTIGSEILANDDTPTRKVPLYMLVRHVQAAYRRYCILDKENMLSDDAKYSKSDSWNEKDQFSRDFPDL